MMRLIETKFKKLEIGDKFEFSFLIWQKMATGAGHEINARVLTPPGESQIFGNLNMNERVRRIETAPQEEYIYKLKNL